MGRDVGSPVPSAFMTRVRTSGRCASIPALSRRSVIPSGDQRGTSRNRSRATEIVRWSGWHRPWRLTTHQTAETRRTSLPASVNRISSPIRRAPRGIRRGSGDVELTDRRRRRRRRSRMLETPSASRQTIRSTRPVGRERIAGDGFKRRGVTSVQPGLPSARATSATTWARRSSRRRAFRTNATRVPSRENAVAVELGAGHDRGG